jgi:hypothetical protein
MEKIHFYDGVIGFEVDFLNNKLKNLKNGNVEVISNENLEQLTWVVSNNLTHLEQKKDRMIMRINQKEEMVRIPIIDGAIFHEKLTPSKLESFKTKLVTVEEEIIFLKKINYKKMIK